MFSPFRRWFYCYLKSAQNAVFCCVWRAEEQPSARHSASTPVCSSALNLCVQTVLSRSSVGCVSSDNKLSSSTHPPSSTRQNSLYGGGQAPLRLPPTTVRSSKLDCGGLHPPEPLQRTVGRSSLLCLLSSQAWRPAGASPPDPSQSVDKLHFALCFMFCYCS